MKGTDVVSGEIPLGDQKKGFRLHNMEQLNDKLNIVNKNEVPVIVQEIVKGPDTNHFKYCAYISSNGTILAEFTLRKIRQVPIRFGVGAVEKAYFILS